MTEARTLSEDEVRGSLLTILGEIQWNLEGKTSKHLKKMIIERFAQRGETVSVDKKVLLAAFTEVLQTQGVSGQAEGGPSEAADEVAAPVDDKAERKRQKQARREARDRKRRAKAERKAAQEKRKQRRQKRDKAPATAKPKKAGKRKRDEADAAEAGADKPAGDDGADGPPPDEPAAGASDARADTAASASASAGNASESESESDSDAGSASYEVSQPRKRSKRQQNRKRRAAAAAAAEGSDDDGHFEAPDRKPLSAVDQALANMKKKKLKPEQSQLMEDMRQFVFEMEDACESDRAAYYSKQPAFAKLAMLPKVKNTLRMSHLHEILIGKGILKIIKDWLDPMKDGTLPSLTVRTALLHALHDSLPERLGSDDLKESRVGHVVMFLSQHPAETEENRNICRRLIARWSRPIYDRATNYEDVLQQVKQVPLDNADERRAQRRAEKQAARRRQKARRRKQPADGSSSGSSSASSSLSSESDLLDSDSDSGDERDGDDRLGKGSGNQGRARPRPSSQTSGVASSLTCGKNKFTDVSKLTYDTTVQTSEITGKIRRPHVNIPHSAPRTFSVMPASTVSGTGAQRADRLTGADEAEEAAEPRARLANSRGGGGGGARQVSTIEQKMANIKRKQASRNRRANGVAVSKIVL